MHLVYAHHGRQFFFLTICVRGRRAVLSRLAEGAKRPDLTRAGSCVKVLWLAIHGLNPALTAGEFIIIPDQRRLREEPHTRWIKTLAQGLPPRYDPSFADSRELAAGRLLILGALPVGAPFDRNSCHTMNAHAAEMCRRARGEIQKKENIR